MNNLRRGSLLKNSRTRLIPPAEAGWEKAKLLRRWPKGPLYLILNHQ